jgi:hypothetical protein
VGLGSPDAAGCGDGTGRGTRGGRSHGERTAAFLRGHITQSDAEAITGKKGEAALRSVLDTEEYAQLKDVTTSLEVTAP